MSMHPLHVYDRAPLAARPLTREQFGLTVRPLHREFYASTREALPEGKPRTHLPGSKGIRYGTEEEAAWIRAQELYLMRTRPELWDDRTVDSTLDLARTAAKRDGLLVADCHHCKTTTAVHHNARGCTHCGTEF